MHAALHARPRRRTEGIAHLPGEAIPRAARDTLLQTALLVSSAAPPHSRRHCAAGRQGRRRSSRPGAGYRGRCSPRSSVNLYAGLQPI